MRFSKKRISFYLIFFVGLYFFLMLDMPYYIQKPGSIEALDAIVEIDGNYDSEGEMHLVTVSALQATPFQYLLAKVMPHHDITPLHEVFPDGISPEDYMHGQIQVMESSQVDAVVVAYEAAGQEITVDSAIGVVGVVENMPSYGKLEIGDRIIEIDGEQVTKSGDLIEYVADKEAGDTISLGFIRDEEKHETEVTLDYFPEDNSRIGVGITLVTDRQVTAEPEVNFSSGNIGGPSAGLIFALEIYDQLLEKDITKGYNIVATGQIDEAGNVYPIGGVDKKTVSAHRAGMDIFFVPNEGGAENSNYKEAQAKAEEIGTGMEIVPVDTFAEALIYLENLPEK